jgi:hypothetical protein
MSSVSVRVELRMLLLRNEEAVEYVLLGNLSLPYQVLAEAGSSTTPQPPF